MLARFSPSPRILLVLLGAVVLLAGAGSETSVTAGDGSPGMIFVSTTTPIAGQQGELLLIRVEPQAGSDRGRSCLFIDSDQYSLSSVYIAEGSGIDGDCGGAPDPMVFSPGTYTLIAGVYSNAAFFDVELLPPPEREIQLTVNVDGDVQVQINGETLSRLLFGDIDCDGDVDALDALAVLRFVATLPPQPAEEGCPEIGA